MRQIIDGGVFDELSIFCEQNDIQLNIDYCDIDINQKIRTITIKPKLLGLRDVFNMCLALVLGYFLFSPK